MGLVANVINLLGAVFLSHAYVTLLRPASILLTPIDSVYSSYEHSLLPSSARPPPASSILPESLDPKINIPLDITLETILSVFLLCVGVVLGSSDLKPIRWNVWAGKMERSKEARKMTELGVGGGNPYAYLEDRPGFLDIRGKRTEFAAWVKDGAEVAKKS